MTSVEYPTDEFPGPGTSPVRSHPVGPAIRLTDPRFFVLLAALAGTSALTAVLGVTDPAAPLSYPSRFLI